MKVLALIGAAAALLVLPQAGLAAPVPVDAATANANNTVPQAVNKADYGSPVCNSRYMYSLCTAANADAYCDGTGFHCNFMNSCGGNCWCE